MNDYDVESRFPIAANSPAPSAEQKQAAVILRSFFVDVALAVNDTIPDGRWKSLALTNLEEALMWANKGLFNEN